VVHVCMVIHLLRVLAQAGTRSLVRCVGYALQRGFKQRNFSGVLFNKHRYSEVGWLLLFN